MPGRTHDQGSYRYQFQGQEGDDEHLGTGNSYAFKYRIHDARIGKFLSIDPLSPKYPHYSPYSFSGNKVIAFRELEGLEESRAGRAIDHKSYAALGTTGLNMDIASANELKEGALRLAGFAGKLFNWGSSWLSAVASIPNLALSDSPSPSDLLPAVTTHGIIPITSPENLQDIHEAAFTWNFTLATVAAGEGAGVLLSPLFNAAITQFAKFASSRTNSRYVSAKVVNEGFEAIGYKPPYQAGSTTIEYEVAAQSGENFVRVHTSQNKFGSWLMKADDVEGLNPLQIQDKFALPSTPTHITDVVVPAGSPMRSGVTAPVQGWGKGGAVQGPLHETTTK